MPINKLIESNTFIISNKSKAKRKSREAIKIKRGRKSFLFLSENKSDKNNDKDIIKKRIIKSFFGGIKIIKNKLMRKRKNK